MVAIRAVVAILLWPVVVCSATFTVDSDADLPDAAPGDGVCQSIGGTGCTLRSAVQEANALPGSDTIVIAGSVDIIRLEGPPLVFSDHGTILSSESGTAVIDGFGMDFRQSALELQGDSCRLSGVVIRRARSHGILIRGAFNQIGGQAPEERVTFLNNGLDVADGAGVCISGATARHNRLVGCWIGLFDVGVSADGNDIGVLITDEASQNEIGEGSSTRNMISGNKSAGIVIRNLARENTAANNWIGLDATGLTALPNGGGGIALVGGAVDNTIGGLDSASGNLISGNTAFGICIADQQTEQNSIVGNIIGLESTTRSSLPNQGWGIVVESGARENSIGIGRTGLNIISGNDSGGVILRGSSTSDNEIRGNWIGTEGRGRAFIGNGSAPGHGVVVSGGAANNMIGGSERSQRNVISAHVGAGILIDGSGSSRNVVLGNLIGTDTLGRFVRGNAAGVLLQDGASDNQIGGAGAYDGNVLSGSLSASFPFGAGVALFGDGTSDNHIQGNHIGTDTSGSRAAPNRTAGVIIGGGASHNLIGGTEAGQGNLISGNGAEEYVPQLGRGIHIFGQGTSGNVIQGNVIGLRSDTVMALPNDGIGIVVSGGASENIIGGTAGGAGNTIAAHPSHGLVIAGAGSARNQIRNNVIKDNDSLGIALQEEGNQSIEPPVLIEADGFQVSGMAGNAGSSIDVYLAAPDSSQAGEARSPIGTGVAAGDGSFSIPVTGALPGDTVTAIETDPNGNSSQFALNLVVQQSTDVLEDGSVLPTTVSLSQNFPNPFNPSTVIRFSLPRLTSVRLTIYNVAGQAVSELVRADLPAGSYSVSWDGRARDGSLVASGVYFYRLTAGDSERSRKMLLLR